ncbi:hypothetical protein [Streptomyces zingiberis]|uniref:Uncharacterized protein n=1 Tax=Streptomyces zingiberis TaxID=2053010 RepID=A0ABX1C7D1_9ACTN|nr:hypothetical protein [Streptomyces zingiberis]NJQ03609.1 hypothetical protein [Streptomyces zingiberis]
MATLRPGVVVVDEQAGRAAEFRRAVGGEGGVRLRLCPVGGGREWEADPGRVRPATPAERLSATLAAANAVSRGERV